MRQSGSSLVGLPVLTPYSLWCIIANHSRASDFALGIFTFLPTSLWISGTTEDQTNAFPFLHFSCPLSTCRRLFDLFGQIGQTRRYRYPRPFPSNPLSLSLLHNSRTR